MKEKTGESMTLKKMAHTHLPNARAIMQTLRDDPLRDALLQGRHGTIWCDDEISPRVLWGIVGWTHYIGGDCHSPYADTIIESLLSGSEIHTTSCFKARICEMHGPRVRKITRYAMDDSTLEVSHLQSLANTLSDDYVIRFIDEALYARIIREGWGEDFVINFEDYADFSRNGLGIVALKNGEIVAGVSSYARFFEGVDIEIITRSDFRGSGLGTALGARYVLECLNRGLRPYWDAANKASVNLAKRLGYTLDHAFELIELQ